MNVSNLQPNNALAGYVQRILVIEDYEASRPFTLPLFANGVPTLLFLTAGGTLNGAPTLGSASSPGNTSPLDGAPAIDSAPTNHLTLFGQTVFPRTLTIRDRFTLIAYFFEPVALHSLFGISPHELTDHPVSLNLLNTKITAELKERLLNADSTEAMLSLLDNYILRLITRARVASNLVTHAAERIASCTSGESLADIQKELYVTDRTLQRLFKNAIGIAPNLYRRICQFNVAFQQLNKGQFSKLSDIAFEHGYADQSHYIRVFKEFTNITPKDYLKWASGA